MGSMQSASSENGENAENNAKKDVTDRISQIMVSKGIDSYSELSRRSGVADSTISRGMRNHTWSGRTLAKIASALGVPESHLRYGSETTHVREGVETYSAGGGDYWQQPDTPDDTSTELPDSYEVICVRLNEDCDIGRSGEKVLAYKNVWPESGDMAYIEFTDGKATIKRVQKVNEGKATERWILQPNDPRHDAQEVSRSDIDQAHKLWGKTYD